MSHAAQAYARASQTTASPREIEAQALLKAARQLQEVQSNWKGAEDFQGIDVVRAIQSFDPCMPCKAHMGFTGTSFTSAKEVTSDGLI